jgi:hypothetical protein
MRQNPAQPRAELPYARHSDRRPGWCLRAETGVKRVMSKRGGVARAEIVDPQYRFRAELLE